MKKLTKHQAAQRQAWTKGTALPVANKPTQFELKVVELGLCRAQYATSKALREWVVAHMDSKYVPEDLLKAYDLVNAWQQEEGMEKPTTLVPPDTEFVNMNVIEEA